MAKIPESMKRQFHTCYDPKKNTGISSLINVSGYYRARIISNDKTGSRAFVSHVMFFEDGIFWAGIFNYQEEGNRVDIDDFFNKLLANPGGYESQLQRGTGGQGLYTISGDTIKAQCFNNPPPPDQYRLSEYTFKIIDKSTIQHLRYDPSVVTYEPAVFVPIKGNLKSDSWIQYESWIYCNPTDAPKRK